MLTKDRPQPWCCFIPAENQAEACRRNSLNLTHEQEQALPNLGCENVAQWNIYSKNDPPDATTQACTAHVGAMLSDGWHDVWPIEKAA